MPITKARTPVNIVAVDSAGRTSTVEFRLVRESPALPPAGDGSAAGDGSDFGAYHALIIANNQYAHLDDLVTPANDGEAIAEILETQYGFEVWEEGVRFLNIREGRARYAEKGRDAVDPYSAPNRG